MSVIPQANILSADRLKRLASHARTLAFVYFILLFTGTHIPVDPGEIVQTSDKLLHYTGYALLTVLVLAGWEFTIGTLQPKHYFAVWLAGTLYGAFDEVTQIPVGRRCDMNDWLADVTGIVSGLLVYRLVRAIVYRTVAWMEAHDARL
jgi:VanZ family protein